ncbi:MAG: aromatic amino acid lyase [Myxococcales bacterium]|nr:aromatic amino acid lyase [Myxococcales bacterium]MCB9520175.1 aromatic amino acid lyase [Myxococcales bacterium]MCB9531203.1 aromatic amino acid lyase [Myxococcales bacterium]
MTQPPRDDSKRPTVAIGGPRLTLDAVVALARGTAAPTLDPNARDRMEASAAVVARLHASGESVYGVTTSVGASVTTAVPPARSAELSLNLLRMHGCGTGRVLDDTEAAAVLAVRLASLAAGKSGVRPIVAERLVELLDRRVLPVIPSEGSVGASGDLTPLSYVAAVLTGEREVRVSGGPEIPAVEGLASIGRDPLPLGPKEALALMNGTSVGSAIACLAWDRAATLTRVATSIAAALSAAVLGNSTHFDAFVHDAKPHDGQRRVAAWMRDDLAYDAATPDRGVRLQDRYSIRCAPHVIGVAVDALEWTRATLETEINGVSDNPVVDVERGIVVHGGNFYGGHVAFVCDALKTAIANLACLLDRQLALLCNPAENEGLPANLVGVTGDGACTHNGFKAVTIATSALAAEALKLTMPASAFSRSTELHNQDKVPMATLAARDLLRVVELTEQVTAMLALATAQAVDLRGDTVTAPGPRTLRDAVRSAVPRLEGDRRMDRDVAAVLELLRAGALGGFSERDATA